MENTSGISYILGKYVRSKDKLLVDRLYIMTHPLINFLNKALKIIFILNNFINLIS